jgi:predicted DCC family thiol-disulfide oxidoreductase YuxK
MQAIGSLLVIYDSGCGLCTGVRDWLQRQDQFLPLEFAASGSEEGRQRFPMVPAGELAVIGDTGEVWLGNHAWIVCLWALRDYRDWAIRLSGPLLLPLARQAFAAISRNRAALSGKLWNRGDSSLIEELQTMAVPGCAPEAK